MNSFAKWVMDIIDTKESPSFGRASTMFVVYFLILWGCYIVSKTTAIPDVPYGWMTIIGLLYGGSAAKEAYIKGKEATANVANPAMEQQAVNN